MILLTSRIVFFNQVLILALILSGCGNRREPTEASRLQPAILAAADDSASASHKQSDGNQQAADEQDNAQSADRIEEDDVIVTPGIVTPGIVTPGEDKPVPPLHPHLSRSIGEGLMPERVSLPAIELDTPVVELGWHAVTNDANQIFSEWDVARYAAGWHKNSALLGQEGNIVLSGHNNVLGAVFRNLDRLKKGDEAVLWADGHKFTYLVDRVMIVPEKYASPEQRAHNATWIQPTDDHRLTLVSCWPRDDNSHRIIVIARPVEAVSSQ